MAEGVYTFKAYAHHDVQLLSHLIGHHWMLAVDSCQDLSNYRSLLCLLHLNLELYFPFPSSLLIITSEARYLNLHTANIQDFSLSLSHTHTHTHKENSIELAGINTGFF